ncbi:response regulator [Paenibacillus sp. J5C_2022]|uniref:response regulator transcription factor n=1 Tax=Paenibacillus sp. J5C2022 TaxID=2977129 RepID=UPI0021D34808|nr:helix-turn-helix domain-containing protein [Paenibacillus sp. J5C2022]MCU6707829.1 response regulator [Paenibacillus sp. J5C2022]
MKKLNVLIVDDELPLRQELRMFPWEDCDAVLIGEASNGEEALRICEEACVPDVVITDITMPIMDGIALIRELKKRYPIVQIVLLTCHSEFQYAQEALRLGALEYILKAAIDDDELKQAMDKVRLAIRRERKSLDSEKAEKRQLQEALFGKLLHQQQLNNSDWNAFELDGKSSYQLIRFIVDVPDSLYLAIKHRVQCLFTELEASHSDRLTWLSVRKQEYFVIFIVQDWDKEPVINTIEDVINRLNAMIRGAEKRHEYTHAVQAVISEPFATGDGLVHSIAGTTAWIEALFYDSLEGNKVHSGLPVPLNPITDTHVKEISEMLRKSAWSADSLLACLRTEFFNWCVIQRIRPEQLKQRILGWLVEWLKLQGDAELINPIITNLMAVQNLSQMMDSLITAIVKIESEKSHSRFEIRSALQWIRDNLKQPISLPIIAEQVGLSPQYVSRLLREETGVSVTQYITQLRMEKAVELLKQTNMKIYEIAEEVGIPSYRYFTVMFRNWTGVPPTDYKRNT